MCRARWRFGVVVAVQNHGDFISSGQEHLGLLNRVGHTNGARPWSDTGKYLTADPYVDIALTGP